MEKVLTIFTPSFNRGYCIKDIYESLDSQADIRFEWLIVDDGSEDNTQEVVFSFMNESSFDVRYYYTKNRGKPSAINYALELAKGDYFLILDSDDVLTSNAIDTVLSDIDKLSDSIGGLCYRRKRKVDSSFIGGDFPSNKFVSNHDELHFRYGYDGDKVEIFKTKLLKDNKFPIFPGEKFIPEGLLWLHYTIQYKLEYHDIAIYECEYLQDGITNNKNAIIRNNPLGFISYYSYLLSLEHASVRIKIFAMLRILYIAIKFIWKK
ncbi:glycosyltransferase family 2 protein [Vibrio breoganii]